MGICCCKNYKVLESDINADNTELTSKTTIAYNVDTTNNITTQYSSNMDNFSPLIAVKDDYSTKNHNKKEERGNIVVALYDYEARDHMDISFRKGDRMKVLDDTEEWFLVHHVNTKQNGYVPGNFVAPLLSIESEDWYFDNTSRMEAETMLLSELNEPGTFLIRRSEHGYSLSVKDVNTEKGSHVKHYKVKSSINSFYVASTVQFETVRELIKYYKSHALGNNLYLNAPCKKTEPVLWDLGFSNRDNWEIPRNELMLIKQLGKGNFGEVYYGKWKNNTEVAIKMLLSEAMSSEDFMEEAAIMKKFKHSKIVALYGVCTVDGPIYIIQEYMSKGSLLTWLRSNKDVGIKLEVLIHIAFQIASGMGHLETLNLIHRDLAARNILLGENNVAKICDFGLARMMQEGDYYTNSKVKLPVKWTAIEAFQHGTFSVKSDVWSYGILLMEIFTYGKMPYAGMNANEVVAKLTKGYRMPKPDQYNLPDDIYEIMTNCWREEPEKRPTFKYLEEYFQVYTVSSELHYQLNVN